MGSIPPAASIEHPQREIVAAIAAGGLTPDNADVAQLVKALKNIDVCNVLKSAVNTGTQTAWAATIPALPAGTTFPVGTAMWFRPNQVSVTGGTTFALNGSAPAQVTLPDRSSIMAHDVSSAFSWLLMFWDGVGWQVLAGISRAPGQTVSLFANATWFVNALVGSDAYDGTQPAVAGTHGPFQTIQRAVNETSKYNMNGYNQTINVADLTTGAKYAWVTLPPTNGAGTVILQGNVATPANCPIHSTTPYSSAIYQAAGNYEVRGFRLTTAGAGVLDGIACTGGQLRISGSVQFGPCQRYHICSARSGSIIVSSAVVTIEAAAAASAHLACETNGSLGLDAAQPSSLVVQGSVNLAQFISSTYAASFIGYYTPITGFANVHGLKYSASMNGLVGTLGQGTTAIPGDVAGAASTGGQYQA